MDIFQLSIAKSSPKEAANLIKDLVAESERRRAALDRLRSDVLYVVSQPDYTNPEEMVRKLKDALSRSE